MFNIIFAIDRGGVVGDSASRFGMPWHYPEDLKFYKSKTTGQNCIMGRTTYKAIGSALPNRRTFVLSRDENYRLDDAQVVNNIDYFKDDKEWWICGGVQVFKQFWNLADNIYITRINEHHRGDVTFEGFDLSNFKLESKKNGENPKLVFEKWVKNEN